MADFVLGVAGHVDHGKTALTYALTGVETDRLTEEKRRGLSIEPGFAPFPLPGGGVAALVDVPGHEHFLRNMIAGAAGLDAVLLTVAADDGVMPQTREHLEICTLLGVELGLVVITKIDLVDAARLSLLTEEVRALSDAPILPVSARTGAGLEELKTAIAALAGRVKPRETDAPFRMSIDRVFHKPGFGTVVTGTVEAGMVRVGEEIGLYSSGLTARVRGIQRHGAEVAHIEAGHRAALNLAGVDRDAIHRGDTAAAPGSMEVSTFWEVELTSPPKAGTRLRLYHGTAEVLCRCSPARVRLEAPLAARVGDRFVLRTLSPATTVGGGVVLGFGPVRVAEKADPLEILAGYHAHYPLRYGMNQSELLQKSGGTPEELEKNGAIKLRKGLAALVGFRPKYTPELAAVRDKIELTYRRAKWAPEKNSVVDAAFGGEVLDKLLRDGVLVPLGAEYRIHRDCLKRAEEVLRAAGRDITLGQYRDALGVSRKYALLLLEHFRYNAIWEQKGIW